MKKSQHMLAWLSKIVLAQNFAQLAEAAKKHSKAQHMPEKSVMNMI
jgi:hypothetical protein